MSFKKCQDCGLKKEMYKGSRCFECFKKHKSEVDKRWRDRNIERKRKRDREYREKNKEKISKKKKERYYSGVTKYCKNCGKIYKRPLNKAKKFCSNNCQFEFWRQYGVRKRENNPAWKNGNHSNTYKNIFLEDIKKKGIDLEKEGCQLCGRVNSLAYDIHHIVFRSECPNHPYLNDPINMIYLCRSCHSRLHYKKNRRKQLVQERGLEDIFNKQLYDKDKD